MWLHVCLRCETRNHLWLVLEYCVGGDLMSLLKEEPGLSEDSVQGFARDIALALQHVHVSGLVSLRRSHYATSSACRKMPNLAGMP